MKSRLSKLVLFAPLLCILIASFNTAYGSFDSNGNYYCNPTNLPLEKTIYKESLSKINSDLTEYRSLNPAATVEELHNYIAQGNAGVADSYTIMNQAKACLDSNGVDSSSVATASPYLLAIFSAPEFGSGVVIFAATMPFVLFFKVYAAKSGIMRE